MILFNALRDFADGLTCGFSLFFTERNDHTANAVTLGFKARRSGR